MGRGRSHDARGAGAVAASVPCDSGAGRRWGNTLMGGAGRSATKGRRRRGGSCARQAGLAQLVGPSETRGWRLALGRARRKGRGELGCGKKKASGRKACGPK